jgi:putative endopeptidase
MPQQTKSKRKNSKTSKTNRTTRKISKKQQQLICKNAANTFKRFENEYEKSLKGNLKKINTKAEKEMIRLFKIPFSPSSLTAQSDYYTFINYRWIKEKTEFSKKIKKYYTKLDSFRITQEKVYYELLDLTRKYISTHNNNKSAELKNVYTSFLHLNPSEAEQHVTSTVEEIDRFIADGNLLKFLAHINSNEMVSWASPLVWSVMPDEKNAQYYKSTFCAPTLSIYDYTIYIEDTADDENNKHFKKDFISHFLKYINQMFNACLGDNHGLNAKDVFDVEYEILINLGCNSVKKDSAEYYNVVNADESLEKYGFDWKTFSSYLGYERPPSSFIVTSLSYFKCITKTLNENWTTPRWRAYWIYMYLRQIIRFSKKWRPIYYNFNGKFVSGQPGMIPEKLYPVFGLAMCFNTFLTNEYIEHNKRQEYIDYVSNLAYDLKKVFIRIIKRNTWLSPSTKKAALMKLTHLKLTIGSPKILNPDPMICYSSTDTWGNLLKLADWKNRKMIKLEGDHLTDMPTIDWSTLSFVGSQAYIVNAYYTPTQNTIYVPLGYLQKPFIDLDERGIEYNLARIGYTLGHEMSHSLDDTGSKYDYKGNLNDWWTPRDRKIFNRKVANVVKQYETFAAYDGIKMDASLSTGENLADISGMAICEEYLRDFQDKNDDIIPIRSISFEAFFIYLAMQARQKVYDKAVHALLKTNPHPLDKYRTNCPLARLKLFTSIYNIKKGDKMYWENQDTIW